MVKRAQAALEFLMTYGWAILVVLVVIGTLAYFGILNPQVLLPEKCTLQMGLYCKDHLIDLSADTVKVTLENGMGKDIVITQVSFSGTNMVCATAAGTTTVNNGASQEFTTALCTTGINAVDVGKKIKSDIIITWYYADSTAAYTHTMNGELLGKVEP